MQIDDLRAELKHLGLDSSGQKPDVTKRLLEFLSSRENKERLGIKVRVLDSRVIRLALDAGVWPNCMRLGAAVAAVCPIRNRSLVTPSAHRGSLAWVGRVLAMDRGDGQWGVIGGTSATHV